MTTLTQSMARAKRIPSPTLWYIGLRWSKHQPRPKHSDQPFFDEPRKRYNHKLSNTPRTGIDNTKELEHGSVSNILALEILIHKIGFLVLLESLDCTQGWPELISLIHQIRITWCPQVQNRPNMIISNLMILLARQKMRRLQHVLDLSTI